MTPARTLLLAGVAWLAAGAALAQDCTAQVDVLDAELDDAAQASISASSGGQGVASSREAQAMETVTEGEELEESVAPYQEDEAEAVERAEDAGEGGDLVMQAIALAEEARASAEGGDEAACLEALANASELLDEYRASLGGGAASAD